ncbi:hypothetical protein ACJZ2D_017149 [Fusarium nematophilum]
MHFTSAIYAVTTLLAFTDIANASGSSKKWHVETFSGPACIRSTRVGTYWGTGQSGCENLEKFKDPITTIRFTIGKNDKYRCRILVGWTKSNSCKGTSQLMYDESCSGPMSDGFKPQKEFKSFKVINGC